MIRMNIVKKPTSQLQVHRIKHRYKRHIAPKYEISKQKKSVNRKSLRVKVKSVRTVIIKELESTLTSNLE